MGKYTDAPLIIGVILNHLTFKAEHFCNLTPFLLHCVRLILVWSLSYFLSHRYFLEGFRPLCYYVSCFNL